MIYPEMDTRKWARVHIACFHIISPHVLEAYSKITTNLLAIIFIVLVDLVFASERASETWRG